ncbi:MAG: hypothetical protein IIX54_02575 [Clostridia bacterium]|nr:hypothetical protein [Clostridia bacterium]
MFGYIRASKPEMRIKEYELYKAVYCSLCKEMGKTYGVFSRFTLSYDFTFYALLNMALKTDSCDIVKKACTCNPLKKCSYLSVRKDMQMPAAASMILCYFKLMDNINDEKGLKKIKYFLVKPFIASAYKKASKLYPELNKIAEDYINNQTYIEKDNCSNIDMAAEPTAKCLAEMFKLLSADEMQKRCLDRVGYSIGRYIYILDAAVDLDEDIKLGRYNPLTKMQQEGDYTKDFIAGQLNICVGEAAKAYELLDIKKFKNILDNLIYLGLQDTFKKELKI